MAVELLAVVANFEADTAHKPFADSLYRFIFFYSGFTAESNTNYMARTDTKLFSIADG